MTDSQRSIQPVTNLFQYFRSELLSACDDLGLTTTEETQAYLAHLLEGFVRLNERTAQEVGFHKPAAFLLGEALQSAGDRRIEAYRRLGDTSLFSCGFFEDHLQRSRSLVKAEYYRSMGRSAYSSLHDLISFRAPGSAFQVIFAELARKFDTIVEAFRVLATGRTDQDRARADLFSRWHRGEEIDGKLLARLGLMPATGGDA